MAQRVDITSAMTREEVEQFRHDTPGVGHSAYFMNAGASLMPQPVDAAIREHLDREMQLGGYGAADAFADELDGVYTSVARLIGAAPDEIAITENATVAWQMAFYSQKLKAGDRILTCEAEYGANYVAFLQMRKRLGVEIDVVPSDATGQIDTEALEAMIDDRVRLIAITWVPTNGGLVNPVEQVGEIAHRHGIFYLLDACQSVGQMDVDVQALHVDALSATGRKFLRGPRGTGFLYARRSVLENMEPPVLDHFSAPWTILDEYTLRADARRFETWENAYALRAGLRAAVDYAMDIGIDRIQERSTMLADRLRHGLAASDRIRVLDLGVTPCAIVSFVIDGQPAHDIVESASRSGFTIGTSGPHSTLIDATRRGLPVVNRASPHYFNTEDEIDRLTEFLVGASA